MTNGFVASAIFWGLGALLIVYLVIRLQKKWLHE